MRKVADKSYKENKNYGIFEKIRHKKLFELATTWSLHCTVASTSNRLGEVLR